MPFDPDLLRKDLLNCKVMGFNMIRFIGASLGSTVFGVILAGAAAGTVMRGYRLDFGLMIAVALAAVALALSLPDHSRPTEHGHS